MNVINWFVGAADGIVNALVYIVIFLIFLSGLLRCIFPVMRIRGVIRKAIRSIKQGERGKRSWQEDNFLGKGPLYPHWCDFLNNLFFADGVYHNASNVEDYINEETTIYGPGRSSFADAIPGLLVSLGFLGTLIGLAIGLSGFRMTDTEAVQQSIESLIPGMRYAFMTSIAGVVGSVAFTLITRFTYGSAEHTLRNFYAAMSRYAGVLSVDPMTQIAIYQQEQTSLIQTMTQDLNGQFTDRLEEMITGSMAPVSESINKFLTVTSQQQMQMLDKVTSRFIEKLDETMNGQFRNLQNTIMDTCRSQEASARLVTRGMEEAEAVLRNVSVLQKNLDAMVANMDGYLQKVTRAQEATEHGYLHLQASAEKMEIVSTQQSGYLKNVSQAITDLTRMTREMQSAQDQLFSRLRDISAENSAGMLKVAGEIRATSAMIEENRQRIGEQLKMDLSDTLDSFRDYMREFTHRVDYLTDGIGKALENLPRAVDETAEGLLEQVDRLTRAMENSRRAIEQVLGAEEDR